MSDRARSRGAPRVPPGLSTVEMQAHQSTPQTDWLRASPLISPTNQLQPPDPAKTLSSSASCSPTTWRLHPNLSRLVNALALWLTVQRTSHCPAKCSAIARRLTEPHTSHCRAKCSALAHRLTVPRTSHCPAKCSALAHRLTVQRTSHCPAKCSALAPRLTVQRTSHCPAT